MGSKSGRKRRQREQQRLAEEKKRRAREDTSSDEPSPAVAPSESEAGLASSTASTVSSADAEAHTPPTADLEATAAEESTTDAELVATETVADGPDPTTLNEGLEEGMTEAPQPEGEEPPITADGSPRLDRDDSFTWHPPAGPAPHAAPPAVSQSESRGASTPESPAPSPWAAIQVLFEQTWHWHDRVRAHLRWKQERDLVAWRARVAGAMILIVIVLAFLLAGMEVR